MRLIGVMILLGACHAGSVAGPDTPGGPEDGAPHGLGLFVTWRANPPLPGILSDKITVTEATFQVDHFQIVADAGSVIRSKYLLSWEAGTKPGQDSFPDARPGRYQEAELVMMGGNFGEDAFRIQGTWQASAISVLVPFEIHDRSPLSIPLKLDETLSPAGSVMFGITVDLRNALDGIDFGNLELDDGVLEIDDGQELLDFRSRLQQAFTLDN